MNDTQPGDFVTMQVWCETYGGTLLHDWKMLHYHTKPIQRQLMEAGALAKVGRLVYLHKERFWGAFQAIQAQHIEAN